MLTRTATIVGVAVALLAISATPTMAHNLTITVTATCACEYTVTATGNTDAGAVVTADYAFTVTSNGIDYSVSGQIHTTADANGNFSETIPGLTLPGGCTDTVFFSAGSASLTFNGTTESGFSVDLPSTLFCSTTPPPPGKALAIGPSSMEGHLLIRPGDWINGGYSFVFVNGGHAAPR